MIAALHRLVHSAVMRWLDVRGFRAIRREVCAGATGAVLDLGAGTGSNIPWMTGAASLTLIEPDAALQPLLQRRAARNGVPAAAHVGHAERIPFADATFDTVVVTLVMCSVDDPALALAEIRRVLRPGGTLRFAEHVRSPDPSVAQRQDRWCGVWHRTSGGCRPNRDTLAALLDAGFAPTIRRTAMAGVPAIVRPLIVGSATRS